MWAFKTLWDKGLIYEGFRVLAYCWRCETPLSNTETRMDDTYRDRQDPALTVAFELETGERILAWTTTPWTLPSNLALAVGTDIDYAVVELDGVRYIIAEALLGVVRRGAGRSDDASTRCKGADLVGRTYTPLFDFFADTAKWGTEQAFQVLGRRLRLDRRRHGRRAHGTRLRRGRPDACRTPPASRPSARWTSTASSPAEVGPWEGAHVFDANPLVIRAPEGARRRAPPRHLRPLVSALLALRPAARVPGDLVVVREGHRVPRPDGRAQPADHLAAGPHQGRQLRQVARERPRLVDQPEPLLGFADPGVAVRRPEPTRASTSTARSPNSKPTSA